jgi:hypothetical protein
MLDIQLICHEIGFSDRMHFNRQKPKRQCWVSTGKLNEIGTQLGTVGLLPPYTRNISIIEECETHYKITETMALQSNSCAFTTAMWLSSQT